MKRNISIIILSVFIIGMEACVKREIDLQADGKIQFHLAEKFDVRKCIPTSKNGFAFAGMIDGHPGIIVFNPDFTVDFTYIEDYYKFGGLNDIAEFPNGSYYSVGYFVDNPTQDPFLDSTRASAFELIVDDKGGFVDAINLRSTSHDQYLSVNLNEASGEIALCGVINQSHLTILVKDSNALSNIDNHGFFNRASDVVFSKADGNLLVAVDLDHTPLNLRFKYEPSFILLNSKDSLKTIWTTTVTQYRRAANNWSIINTEVLALDDGFLCATEYLGDGVQDEAMLLIKLGFDGSVLFEKLYYGDGDAMFSNIVPFSGGYLILGSTISSTTKGGFSQAYVLAIKHSGEVIWEAKLGSLNKVQEAMTALETNDEFWIAGTSLDELGRTTLMKYILDKNGVLKE